MKYIEWIFSGIGVTIIVFIFNYISNLIKRKKKINKREYNDNSKFISEYPPDGINILVGTTFEKQWTIQNTGNMIWTNRYLECINFVPNAFYPNKIKVKIPKLRPGNKFTLKVKYYAKIEGEYFLLWKMFDENNEMTFPEKTGLGVYVKVVNDKLYI